MYQLNQLVQDCQQYTISTHLRLVIYNTRNTKQLFIWVKEGWWKKSCTSWYGEYPVLIGFQTSQVVQDFFHQQYPLNGTSRSICFLFSMAASWFFDYQVPTTLSNTVQSPEHVNARHSSPKQTKIYCGSNLAPSGRYKNNQNRGFRNCLNIVHSDFILRISAAFSSNSRLSSSKGLKAEGKILWGSNNLGFANIITVQILKAKMLRYVEPKNHSTLRHTQILMRQLEVSVGSAWIEWQYFVGHQSIWLWREYGIQKQTCLYPPRSLT